MFCHDHDADIVWIILALFGLLVIGQLLWG